MNKKLLAGLSALVATGAFWACGEGNINKYDEMDGIVADQYTTPEQRAELKKKAIESCKADSLGCALTYADYLKDPDAPMSSEGEVASSESTVNSSSDGTIPKSSAGWVIKSSSSSVGGTDPVGSSSSAGGVVVTGLGVCAPGKATIDKGGSVAWNFTPNLSEGSMQDFLGASYSWNFGSDGDGTGMTSSPVTSGTSGKKTATLTVTMGMKNSTIDCTPLQVNGVPITCTCTTDALSTYDYTGASGATVSWTATCSSTGATITEYQWSGAEGTSEIGTYTFDSETTVAPKVTVSNDDNSVQEFECPAVRGTEGPENEFDLSTATDDEKTLKEGVTYTITHPYASAISFNGSTADCKVELNGESVEVSHYKAIQPAPASPLIVKPLNCTATIGGY